MPANGSSAIVGTKLYAPVERDVKVLIEPASTSSDILRLWVNEDVVFNSRSGEAPDAKTFRLRAGMNTVAASWRTGARPTGAPGIRLNFRDAKTRQPVTDLVMDMEGK